MKRVARFSLALLYLVFTTGATLHTHICMGDTVSTSLFADQDGPCSKCGMEKHEQANDCCKDVPTTLKVTDDHYPAFDAYPTRSSWVLLEQCLPGITTTIHPVAIATPSRSFADSGPPGHSSVPLYLMIRVLRL
ncbi:HYC_CC_PP family protein [Flaviaesturariibacter amylovorans]|uniref:HYC_CC_PP family protein n=1 Tax=Flaviaesturariibacter amylovorans TaxID=1084520 RepID=UPI0031ED6452